jgi:hypothetical protein
VAALGVAQGKDVGRLLGLIERWWIARDFVPGRRECLSRLAELAGKSRGR